MQRELESKIFNIGINELPVDTEIVNNIVTEKDFRNEEGNLNS